MPNVFVKLLFFSLVLTTCLHLSQAKHHKRHKHHKHHKHIHHNTHHDILQIESRFIDANEGHDSNICGLDAKSACKTMQFAISTTNIDDAVLKLILLPGTYHHPGNMHFETNRPVRLVSASQDPRDVVIDFSKIKQLKKKRESTSTTSPIKHFLKLSKKVTIERITFTNLQLATTKLSSSSSSSFSLIDASKSDEIILKNCIFANFTNNIIDNDINGNNNKNKRSLFLPTLINISGKQFSEGNSVAKIINCKFNNLIQFNIANIEASSIIIKNLQVNNITNNYIANKDYLLSLSNHHHHSFASTPLNSKIFNIKIDNSTFNNITINNDNKHNSNFALFNINGRNVVFNSSTFHLNNSKSYSKHIDNNEIPLYYIRTKSYLTNINIINCLFDNSYVQYSFGNLTITNSTFLNSTNAVKLFTSFNKNDESNKLLNQKNNNNNNNNNESLTINNCTFINNVNAIKLSYPVNVLLNINSTNFINNSIALKVKNENSNDIDNNVNNEIQSNFKSNIIISNSNFINSSKAIYYKSIHSYLIGNQFSIINSTFESSKSNSEAIFINKKSASLITPLSINITNTTFNVIGSDNINNNYAKYVDIRCSDSSSKVILNQSNPSNNDNIKYSSNCDVIYVNENEHDTSTISEQPYTIIIDGFSSISELDTTTSYTIVYVSIFLAVLFFISYYLLRSFTSFCMLSNVKQLQSAIV